MPSNATWCYGRCGREMQRHEEPWFAAIGRQDTPQGSRTARFPLCPDCAKAKRSEFLARVSDGKVIRLPDNSLASELKLRNGDYDDNEGDDDDGDG